MSKKPITIRDEESVVKTGYANLTRLELIQLEQLKKGMKISPCRGSVDPLSKSYIMDVTCAEFMSEEERLTVCQRKEADITLALIRRHFKFTLDNFPNLLKEEVRETVENNLKVIRKRIVPTDLLLKHHSSHVPNSAQ